MWNCNGLDYTVLKVLNNSHNASKDCLLMPAKSPGSRTEREPEAGSSSVRTCGSREPVTYSKSEM